MQVKISNYDKSKIEAIKKAACAEWPFNNPDSFTVSGDGTVEASAEGNLCGGETEQNFARKLAKAISKANGKTCNVAVTATYLEDLSSETYEFGKAGGALRSELVPHRMEEGQNMASKLTIQRLLELAAKRKIKPHMLEDLVHDLKSGEAGSVNNHGLASQLEYLVQAMGEGAVRDQLKSIGKGRVSKKQAAPKKANARIQKNVKTLGMEQDVAISTVNVIEMAGDKIIGLVSFPDDKAGNLAAEELFISLCKANTDSFANLSEKEAAGVLDDGHYDDHGTPARNSDPWSVKIFHSTGDSVTPMAYAKVFVKEEDGHTQEFKSEKDAAEAIAADFAESDSNPVAEVWAEDASGKEINLSVEWRVRLQKA